MLPKKMYMDVGGRAYEQFCNQQYILHVNNVTIKDNGAYKVQITYSENVHEESMVIGTIVLFLNGKILIS